MVYHKKFVVAVKAGGKVLRESDDSVFLPFGVEYTLLLKNLNSVRTQARVTIDGQEATEGTWLIIPANGEIELERFIKGGNLRTGNRFKFIERSAGVEAHRGIKADDGLIRIEYQTEKVPVFVNPPIYVQPRRRRYDDHWQGMAGYNSMGGQHVNSGSGMMRSATFTSGGSSICSMDSIQEQDMKFDAGITVPGSQSNQQFQMTNGFPVLPGSEVIVLHLRGMVGSVPVAIPLTVQHKPVCVTCGKTNRASSKFCAACGTALEIFA